MTDAHTTSSHWAAAPDVFVSHTGQDREACTFAMLLHECLKHEKVHTFIDFEIEAGKEFKPEILESVKGCKIFICVLCPIYFTRDWCLRELEAAIETNRKIVPIAYRSIKPKDPSHSYSWPWWFRDTRPFSDLRVSEQAQTLLNKVFAMQILGPPAGDEKREIVVLKNRVVEDVKVKLDYVFPTHPVKVQIRVARDEVYVPDQKHWMLGSGPSLSNGGDDDDNTNFSTVSRDNGLWFTIKQNPIPCDGDRCRYSYDIVADDGRSLVVDPPSKIADRDMFTKYVCLHKQKDEHGLARYRYPWFVDPQGGGQFHISYIRSEANALSAAGNDNIASSVKQNKVMGLAAHRFWPEDRVSESSTKVMVSLQNEFKGLWWIRKEKAVS